MTPPAFPTVNRPDSELVLVTPLYVGTADVQQAVADALLAEWEATSRPEGLLSQTCYVSTEGENVWTYEQWTGLAAYRASGRMYLQPPTLRGRGVDGADVERCAPIAFKRYRSTVFDTVSTPTRIVAPMFDVDGRATQRTIIDRLLDGPLTEATPGLLSAHFHYSLDGSRVLNYAEFTEDEAHVDFLASPIAQATTKLTQDTPGVRGIGGKRYLLHGSVGAPPAAS
ncbi:antibiotic biosynthesis monooxygenase [Streptomyces sp. NBC_01525]|uniref:Monooxygenase n=1 Tax=Streptomyces benahoarensis TaxID=2595054 RepID=A0A553ZLM6_9ACTN|nr:antibiotic biosynthesis monooxygenase [Streptomyces benahoarensis]TSB22379.1 monooxygenase [Streptomyces benahoarensis]TSB42196.1 monooxygenase [Streptomyces benahoarensis]